MLFMLLLLISVDGGVEGIRFVLAHDVPVYTVQQMCFPSIIRFYCDYFF